MPKKIALSLGLILLLASAAAAQDGPTSFLEESVTFKPPAGWVVGPYVNGATQGRASMTIPYPAAEGAKQTARVSLVAHIVPEKVTVREQSEGVYANKYEGLAVLSDTFDGDDWRTVVWTFKADVPVLMLDRYGVVGRKSVQLWAALPLVEGGDPKWLEKAVADFNAACESLKIDGRNSFEHKVEWKNLRERLKVKR